MEGHKLAIEAHREDLNAAKAEVEAARQAFYDLQEKARHSSTRAKRQPAVPSTQEGARQDFMNFQQAMGQAVVRLEKALVQEARLRVFKPTCRAPEDGPLSTSRQHYTQEDRKHVQY